MSIEAVIIYRREYDDWICSRIDGNVRVEVGHGKTPDGAYDEMMFYLDQHGGKADGG